MTTYTAKPNGKKVSYDGLNNFEKAWMGKIAELLKTEAQTKQAVVKAKNDYARNYRAQPRPRVRGGYPTAGTSLRDINEHKWKGVIR